MKIKRNDKCYCGSTKKYKMCCLAKNELEKEKINDQLNNGHEISSQKVVECVECLREIYYDFKIMDISNYLSDDTYVTFQKRHFNNKVLMVAERNDTNNAVFKKRGPDNVNIMVMYQGAYRCFQFDDLTFALDHINAMIKKKN